MEWPSELAHMSYLVEEYTVDTADFAHKDWPIVVDHNRADSVGLVADTVAGDIVADIAEVAVALAGTAVPADTVDLVDIVGTAPADIAQDFGRAVDTAVEIFPAFP